MVVLPYVETVLPTQRRINSLAAQRVAGGALKNRVRKLSGAGVHSSQPPPSNGKETGRRHAVQVP